jgi:hypothetical protein
MADAKTIPLTIVADGSVPTSAGLVEGGKQLGGDKIGRSPVKFDESAPVLRKPSWIRVRIPAGNAVAKLKSKLRENRLVTVCEEASCPNIHECFNHGTATSWCWARCARGAARSATSPTAARSRRTRTSRPTSRAPSPTWACATW